MQRLGEMVCHHKSRLNLLVCFFFFSVCAIRAAVCLHCYQCDSSAVDDLNCHWNRNFTQWPTELCPTTQNSPWLGELGCARINMTMLEDGGAENWYVFRGCMPKSSCNVLKMNNSIKTRNFTTTECYICDTDLCNTKRRLKLGQLLN